MSLMRRSLGLAVAATTALAAMTASAETFEFEVRGTHVATNQSYTGTVQLEEVSTDIARVTWVIAGQTIVGNAVRSGRAFAVSFPGPAGSAPGVGFYSMTPNGAEGRWVYGGDTVISTETWTAK